MVYMTPPGTQISRTAMSLDPTVPRLPWELTDTIIDHLQSDLVALGTCGLVSSGWLKRSRHHIFNTVQLWPWRIRKFAKLTGSKQCTFSEQIQRIELDDSRVKPDVPCVPFTDALTFSPLSRLSQVEAIQVRSVDWTALSFSEQAYLRQRISRFKLLKRLELDDVTFHDLREVVHIATSFPLLKQLSANVFFTKMREHAVAGAAKLRLPSNVETLELATDDGIPVVLASVLAADANPHVTRLNLRNLTPEHLPLLKSVTRKMGASLKHVLLGIDGTSWKDLDEEDFFRSMKLSRLSQLRTLHLEGLSIRERPAALEYNLFRLLSRLESPFLQQITLSFGLQHFEHLDAFDWTSLERALKELNFFGLQMVHIKIRADPTVDTLAIEKWVRRALKDVDERDALSISVYT